MHYGWRMTYPFERTANMSPNKPLGGKQRHLGVVRDGAVQPHVRWQLRNAVRVTTADFRERQELDLGTQTVPDGTTQKTCMESDQRQPFMSGVIGHKALLNPRLYCPGPCGQMFRDLHEGSGQKLVVTGAMMPKTARKWSPPWPVRMCRSSPF